MLLLEDKKEREVTNLAGTHKSDEAMTNSVQCHNTYLCIQIYVYVYVYMYI